MCEQKRKVWNPSCFYVSFFTAACESESKLCTVGCLERLLGIFIYCFLQVTWWHDSAILSYFVRHSNITSPGGRAVWGVSQRPLDFYDCGFESRRGHGCLSVVSVVFWQAKGFPSGWSLVQRSTTAFGVSSWVRSHIGAVETQQKRKAKECAG